MQFLGWTAIVLAILNFFGQFSVYDKDATRSQLIGIKAVLWFIVAAMCFK